MKRAIWSAMACVILILAPAASLLASPARAKAADMLVLRTGLGTTARLATMGVDGTPALNLPLGLLDRSGSTLYAARSQADGTSLIQVIDVATGITLRSMKVQGTFSTQSGDYADAAVTPPWLTNGTPATITRLSGGAILAPAAAAAPLLAARPVDVRAPSPARAGFPADGSQVLRALSFNARWLALRESDGNTSRIIVVDTKKMRVVADDTLSGQFGLDAITADGKVLYLIESLPNIGYGVYQVRSFSVDRNVLDRKVIVERGEQPGSMSGEAWTRQWSPDGTWLYTLYVEASGHAFIHALNLQARQTKCLDFPPISSNVALMAHFTLSVAPDGRTLYAVNPVLGAAVAVQNLPRGTMRLVHLARRTGAPMRTQTGAAIAADGKSVFVATGSGVWVVDTRTLALKRAYVADQEVASVAMSGDGRQLFALSPASGQIDVLDPARGTLTTAVQSAANALAIEGVS